MIQLPAVERRVVRSNQGRDRELVRYVGQSRWYRGLANAQIALQLGQDPARRA